MCLYTSKDQQCNHPECKIVGSIVQDNREFLAQYERDYPQNPRQLSQKQPTSSNSWTNNPAKVQIEYMKEQKILSQVPGETPVSHQTFYQMRQEYEESNSTQEPTSDSQARFPK